MGASGEEDWRTAGRRLSRAGEPSRLSNSSDEILTLTPKEKAEYNETLQGLREREQSLLAVQEQSGPANLRADFEELSDLLTDVPGKLDGSTMEHKQKLARLITESVTIEEVSVHWLRLTVIWRGPLADRPDVCLIWRQRGKRSDDWMTAEDEYIRANYPEGDKWTMLEHLPRSSWNMIYQRALTLGVHRTAYRQENITENITVDDLNVIPDRELALEIVAEASRRRSKQEFQAYGVWLYSAGLDEVAVEIGHRNATKSRRKSNAALLRSAQPRALPVDWDHWPICQLRL